MFSFRKFRRSTPESKAFQAFVTFGGKRATVKAGILDSAPAEVQKRAIYNNFGTEDIPERPFLNNALRDNKSSYSWMIRKGALAAIIRRKPIADTMEDIGKKMVDDIQHEIITLHTPPNADSTVAKKGFNDPLIETYEMVETVDYEVERG